MNKNISVSPSILAANFLDLRSELDKVKMADYIHYDIMDNHFVPNISFGPKFVKEMVGFSKIKSDMHFMVEHPEDEIKKYFKLQPDLITFHIEAMPSIEAAANLLELIQSNNCKAGIAIKPKTKISAIHSLLPKLDCALVMLVEPGFSGQSLINEATSKIKELDEIRTQDKLKYEIQVDGGIKKDNYKDLIELGATNLVLGSGIFGEKNPQKIIKEIQNSNTPNN